MVRIRLSKDQAESPRDPAANHPGRVRTWRGMTERQWFISLLVASGLLLLLTFRGCVLPSGVGPKSKPASVTSSAAPSAAPATAGQEYTVQAGDTLSGIAQRTGVTLEALAEANNIDLNNRVILRVGQKLQIPAAETQ